MNEPGSLLQESKREGGALTAAAKVLGGAVFSGIMAEETPFGGASSRETSGASDLIGVRSSFSLAQTSRNLLVAIQRRGMILFARIDHAKAAAETLVKLRPMELFVFGYPETEAPLIAKNAAFGVDFPSVCLCGRTSEAASG